MVTTMKKITSDEMLKIAKGLENHHAIFYELFKMGEPTFTTSVPTAAVTFQDGYNVGFKINPKFWSKQSDKQKSFIVCHEVLHVILSHGLRAVDAENMKACNIAMDVVVNELLVKEFEFNRKEIDPKNRLIWHDKIFPKKKNIETEQTFEYYYNHLERKLGNAGSGKSDKFGSTLDDHSKMFGGNIPRDIVEKLRSKLSPQEREELKGKLKSATDNKAGTIAGNLCEVMSNEYVPPSRTWTSLIKKWTRKHFGEETNEVWLRANRRFSNIPDDIILPSELEDQENLERNRIQLYLFLDTSGSCQPIAKHFWKAYKSIPKDKFDIKLFCFDTKVYDVDPKVGELFGFGGTRFYPIEDKIKELVRSGQQYPDIVFVFTDGLGTSVDPEKPERWHWFLTDEGGTQYIPEKSKILYLKDFVT